MSATRRYLEILDRMVTHAIFDPRQRALLAAVAVGYPSWQAVVRAGRLADHVLAPGQRTQAIEKPVFILGHPRSGTTFLHRLLAHDPRFTAPLAWQLVLPSVSLYRTASAARRLPPTRRLARHLERSLFGELTPTHEVRWDLPEEDDWLFLHVAASPTLEFLTRDPSLSRRFWQGDALPASERRAVMRWYRRSIQRHLYCESGRTLLSKNPHFTGWMRTLRQCFPGARFIMLLRDPAEAIASRLAMVTGAWGRRMDPRTLRKDPRIRPAFQASCELYREAEGAWATLPAGVAVRVRYDHLVADPLASLHRVRAHFGWEDEAMPAPMVEAARAAAARLPRRPAKLRHFGLTKQDLADGLGDVDSLWAALGRPPPRSR